MSEAQRQQLSRFLEPREIPRMSRKQEPGKDLLHDGADRLEGHGRFVIDPLLLEEGIRDGAQHDVTVPTGIGAALEVVEPQFGFQLLVLLFDGPALVR